MASGVIHSVLDKFARKERAKGDDFVTCWAMNVTLSYLMNNPYPLLSRQEAVAHASKHLSTIFGAPASTWAKILLSCIVDTSKAEQSVLISGKTTPGHGNILFRGAGTFKDIQVPNVDINKEFDGIRIISIHSERLLDCRLFGIVRVKAFSPDIIPEMEREWSELKPTEGFLLIGNLAESSSQRLIPDVKTDVKSLETVKKTEGKLPMGKFRSVKKWVMRRNSKSNE
nr:MAG: hypothetical protein [Wufeng shrew rhabdovirus 10]